MGEDRKKDTEITAYAAKKIRYGCSVTVNFAFAWLKWMGLAIIAGLVCGIVGCGFHLLIEKATQFRTDNFFIIFFLPLGGLAIVLLYHLLKQDNVDGTNHVIDSIRKDGRVPFRMAPAIVFGTVVTHLFGGSAGREGAALQLGGSLGSTLGRIFKLDKNDMHVMVLCGMSAVFSALFGTPITAVVFVMEVISVGIIYYSALMPCIVASLTGYFLTILLNIHPISYKMVAVPAVDWQSLLLTCAMGVACALVSIIFCVSISGSRQLIKKVIKNDYLRASIGGCIVIALTFIVGCTDYNGAGMNIVDNAIILGTAKPEAFIIKILFTAITLCAGFRGGEIVPTFFVGATFGCMFGQLIGLDAGFGAALGLVGVFCGATNSPLASMILSVELFGASGLPYFAIVCGFSYMLSGYFSLYKSQLIVYDKLKAVFINKKTH